MKSINRFYLYSETANGSLAGEESKINNGTATFRAF